MGTVPPAVDIGGIVIALEGLDLGLDVAVRARYRRFLCDQARAADITLAVRIAGDDVHQPPDMPLVEPSGPRAYRVAYGALTAELDLAAGRGSATVLSTVYIVDSLLRIVVTLAALERDALLVHGSGVRLGNRALVCFGPSGVGKTTVARSVPPEDVLCDEMILLSFDEQGRLRAAGTPFHGDLSVCAPGVLEVAQLVRLNHGSDDTLESLSTAAAARALLNSVLFFCRDEALAERLLALAVRICHGRTSKLTFRRETHVPTFIDGHLRRDTAQAGA
jgi:hypothetical protein